MEAVPAIIGAAASLGSSAIANRASGVPSGSSMTNPLLGGIDLATGQARSAFPAGMNLMTTASQAMNPVLNYYAPLLSGNRGAMTGVLAPQINQIMQAYEAQQQAQGTLAPRSGAVAGMNMMMPYQRAASILDLFRNARNAAAQGMGQAATQVGQLGNALIGGANQSLYAATSAGRTLMDYANQVATQNRGLGQGIGNVIQSQLSKLPVFSGGRGGGGGGLIIPNDTANIPPQAPWGGSLGTANA